ncbi:ABC transporter substrate-binding protein [Geminicoccus harenae]|uniref:ABC transporter substrate-binding protein n=1 Tax=Geminicoccus harenae TaxID=2498453 RepID=UPI00168B64B5|nr:extracellular solute-binding protein [Geminicoccus harenae]
MTIRSWLAGLAMAGVAAGAMPALAAEFDGVTVNILTQTGPAISGPMQARAPEFEKQSGAKINVITVPFSDIYQKLLTDWSTGTNSIDAAVFAPQWMVDYAGSGFLEDLTPRMEGDEALEQDDIAPFFREFSQKYAGKTYMMTFDGDFHMIFYRTDILEELGKQPPKTWEDYLDIAAAAHGKDMNGDGQPDFGSCIGKKRNAQGYWFLTSVAGGYIQAKGTSEGAFFNTEDMTPLIDNAGFRKALEVYKKTSEYGPPDELNLDVADTRVMFVAGRCALSMDWGDIGSMSVDPSMSKVTGKVGATILPGSSEVIDRTTGEFVACDADTCPHAINGLNHAPFAAFGGWGGGINANADPKVKDAAYAFFSYLSQPAQSNQDVTKGETGFNPYRMSQLEDVATWEKMGMGKENAESYLGAIKTSLNSPNMILDLRIPQNQRYQQVVLDTAVARYLAGELDVDATVETVVEGWNEVNEELGTDEQLEAYKATIGAE